MCSSYKQLAYVNAVVTTVVSSGTSGPHGRVAQSPFGTNHTVRFFLTEVLSSADSCGYSRCMTSPSKCIQDNGLFYVTDKQIWDSTKALDEQGSPLRKIFFLQQQKITSLRISPMSALTLPLWDSWRCLLLAVVQREIKSTWKNHLPWLVSYMLYSMQLDHREKSASLDNPFPFLLSQVITRFFLLPDHWDVRSLEASTSGMNTTGLFH